MGVFPLDHIANETWAIVQLHEHPKLGWKGWVMSTKTCNISEIVQGMTKVTIMDYSVSMSHTRFRLVPKSMTLDDLEMAETHFCRKKRITEPTRTRKLSYRKDDCAMRHCALCRPYECPENFRESLTMPPATFPKIFSGRFFRLMLWICIQNLKIFSALPVPKINWWYPKNLGVSRDCRIFSGTPYYLRHG